MSISFDIFKKYLAVTSVFIPEINSNFSHGEIIKELCIDTMSIVELIQFYKICYSHSRYKQMGLV